MLKQIFKRLSSYRYALGFVRGGMQAVMEADHLEVDWVKMPHDCWMADPFVLDVTDNEIILLVEEMPYALHRGIISLLHIDRFSFEILSRKILLKQPYHLSFPAILRKDEHVYVYPESAKNGKLDIYELDVEKEELTFIKTICDDVVWDSYITEIYGEPLMFTAAKSDFQLDIYKWDENIRRFISYQQVLSEKPNSRMGGAVYKYNGAYYYPAQNCEKTYGGAIDVKRIELVNDRVMVLETVKHIESMNKRYPLGLHTLNEYKGIVVIDVKGYRYGMIGAMLESISKIKRKLLNAK